MRYHIATSPLGHFTLATDGTALTGLHFAGDRYFPAVPPDWRLEAADPLLRQAEAELTEYFAGRRAYFSVPVRAAGTPFQQAVWSALGEIAPGSTVSYQQLAERVGRPTAARAVGSAVGHNPICIVVPCHRVVTSSGSLGGYVAGIEHKQALLALEQRLLAAGLADHDSPPRS